MTPDRGVCKKLGVMLTCKFHGTGTYLVKTNVDGLQMIERLEFDRFCRSSFDINNIRKRLPNLNQLTIVHADLPCFSVTFAEHVILNKQLYLVSFNNFNETKSSPIYKKVILKKIFQLSKIILIYKKTIITK